MGHNDLDILYRDVILDHHRSPRNREALLSPELTATGYNPVCGDKLVLELKVDEKGVVRAARVDAQGCSISVASASIMSEEILDKPLQEARALVEKFREMMRGGSVIESDTGEVEALEGVRRFPVRIKCALLPWATLAQAIDEPCPLVDEKIVKTE